MEFECTFEEFKKLAKEFRDSANTINYLRTKDS
jgi:uncharacterized protein YukE